MPGEGSWGSEGAPKEQHRGFPATPANKPASSGAQSKCLYNSAHSMGNKQEELKVCVHLKGYNLISVTET